MQKCLKKAFFYGSLIPLVIYIIWTVGVVSVIKQSDPEFYMQTLTSSVDVGDMVVRINTITSAKYLKELIWVVSILAIITSALGIGMGLLDSWKKQLNISNNKIKHHIALCLLL